MSATVSEARLKLQRMVADPRGYFAEARAEAERDVHREIEHEKRLGLRPRR